MKLASLYLFLLLFGTAAFAQEKIDFVNAADAKIFRGELVFVDSVNRRGTLRLHVDGYFQENRLHHFAMLPYGMIYYRGAPAELRDIPIGTNLYGQFFLPPNPETSIVPIVTKPTPNKPAETHALVLEDGPSRSLKTDNKWVVTKFETEKSLVGQITAKLKQPDPIIGIEGEKQFTIDHSTRIWRGNKVLSISDISDSLPDEIYLSLTWHPKYLYQEFHIADIWLDQKALNIAKRRQREIHLRHIKHRWMPARINSVEYGKFGDAIITATLHGGMDPRLYKDFKADTEGQMAVAESTLRTYWQDHDGCEGQVLSVEKSTNEKPPLGSSGIQIRFQVDRTVVGFQPGKTVRIRPNSWPKIKPPVEERILNLEDRWPSADLFK